MIEESKKRKLSKADAEALIGYATIAKEVFGDWEPYWYQKRILEDLFLLKKKYVFCNWARKSGKSEIACFFLILKALLIPNAELYYISFTQENAYKTVWKRFKQMVPKKYLRNQGIKESDLTIHFANGSTIFLLGSNANTDSLIGTSVDSVVYDEYRVHKPAFHDVMSPNLYKDHCQVLIISTPPDLLEMETGKCKFYGIMRQMCLDNPKNSYYDLSCWDGNPDMQEFYKSEQQDYIKRGQYAEFQREFEAKFVKGTRQSFLHEFKKTDLTPHRTILHMLDGNKNIEWVYSGDASGWKRWGMLFAAVDTKTSDIYILDCLTIASISKDFDAREEAGMTPYKSWPRSTAKMRELNAGSTYKDWHLIQDCQDVPYMDDVNRWYGRDIVFNPVNKKTMTKTEGLTVIRDLKKLNKIYISDRAEELIDEFMSFEVNPVTEQPYKEYDELIDCLRYIIYEYDHLFSKDKILTGLSLEQVESPRITFYKQLEKEQDHKDGIEDTDQGFVIY